MSYIYYNPNPLKLSVGDCTIRAISCALNMSWKRTYLSLAIQGFQMYDMRNSYGYSMGRVYDGGNSYMYYDPRYENSMVRGYSRTSSKSEMIEELHKMMNETGDETVKKAIQEAITKMGK